MTGFMGFPGKVNYLSNCFDIPVRIEDYSKYKSLTFLENYYRMNIIYLELLEELGYSCPSWLKCDLDYLQAKVESYKRR